MGEDEVDIEPYLPTYKFPFLPTAAMLSPEHPSGIATPPLHTLASVPFKWEEQPGKPRPCTDIIVRPEPSKCLEPPPCSKMAKMPSPTTVLDGPYNLGRPKFSSFRLFREEKQSSFDSSSGSGSGSPQSSVDVLLGKNNGRLKMSRLFGRRSLRKQDADGGSFGFSPSSSFAGFDDCSVVVEGKITRNGSFSSFSQAPPLWITMYQGLKQAMPWKRTRKSKKQGAR